MGSIITILDFDDVIKAIEWIKENIRNSSISKYERGKYFYHFSVDKGKKIIIANESSKNPEFTVCTQKMINKSDADFVRKVATIHNMEYTSFADYLIINEDNIFNEYGLLSELSEDVTKELYKKYTNRYVLPITKNFKSSDFELNDVFSEEFDSVCDVLYWEMVAAIEQKYDDYFWKRRFLNG